MAAIPKIIVDTHKHAFHKKQLGNKMLRQMMRSSDRFSETSDLLRDNMYHAEAQKLGLNSIFFPISLTVSGNPGLIPEMNRDFSESGKLFFGTVHPGMDNIDSELVFLKNRGALGIKIVCGTQRFNPLSDSAFSMFKKIEQAEMVVCLHASSRMEESFWGKDAMVTPKTLLEILKVAPGLKVIFAHACGGTDFRDELPELISSFPDNIYSDTACLYYWNLKEPEKTAMILQSAIMTNKFGKLLDNEGDKFFDFSGMRDVFKIIGHDRLFFGSDWPYQRIQDVFSYLERLDITPGNSSEIFFGNFMDFFGSQLSSK